MEKPFRKCPPKAGLRSFFMVNKPKNSLHERNFFKTRYCERSSSKTLKTLTLFFVLNPFPFNGQSCQKKQKESRTRDKSLFRLQKKLTKISF